jgi:hypothetical protein
VSSATAATINNFVRESNLWEQKQTKTNVMRGANLLLFFQYFQYRQTILLFNIDKRYFCSISTNDALNYTDKFMSNITGVIGFKYYLTPLSIC